MNDESEEKVEFVVSDKYKGTAMMGGLRISACKLSLMCQKQYWRDRLCDCGLSI